MFFTMPYMEDTIEVYGEYSPGWSGSREEPPEEEEFIVNAVYYNGSDVSFIVDFEIIEEYFWDNIDEIRSRC
jgi:hypothetical protein